jgi:hypothetical protein
MTRQADNVMQPGAEMRRSRLRRGLALVGALACAALNAALICQLCLPEHQTDAPDEKVSASESPASGEPQPTVVELKLPDVFVGQPCGVRVPLKNGGDKDLRLQEVKIGCTCTEAEVKPRILRSQKTGILELRFKGVQKPGDFGQRVTLEFGSDSAPDTRVNVFAIGTAADWAKVEPSVVDLGQIPVDQPAQALVRVRPAVKGSVSVRALSPDLTVKRIESSKADRGSSSEYRLTLGANPRATFGRRRAEVEFVTSAEGFKAIMVPVFYEYRACVSANPERIVLLDIPPKAPTVRFVEFSSAEQGMPISEPVVSHSLGKALECTWVPSGRPLRLRVEFRPQAGQRFCSGAISLRFPKCGLSIPFVARVADAPPTHGRSVAN